MNSPVLHRKTCAWKGGGTEGLCRGALGNKDKINISMGRRKRDNFYLQQAQSNELRMRQP